LTNTTRVTSKKTIEILHQPRLYIRRLRHSLWQ